MLFLYNVETQKMNSEKVESPRCSICCESESSSQDESFSHYPSSRPFVVPYAQWIPVNRFGSEHTLNDTVYVAKVVEPFYKVCSNKSL